jgi:hypothetical protein
MENILGCNKMAKNKKESSKARKVVVPEPKLLLLNGKLSATSVRFEYVHVGTPFVFQKDTFLKVGKTTALCVQDYNLARGELGAALGEKIVFGKSKLVRLAEIDLCIKLIGDVEAPVLLAVPTSAEDCATKAQVEAAPKVSDITAAVTQRAG